MENTTVKKVLAAWDFASVNNVTIPVGTVAAMRSSGALVSLQETAHVPLVYHGRVVAEPVYLVSDSVRARSARLEATVVDMATRFTPQQVVFVLLQQRASFTPDIAHLPHVAYRFDVADKPGLMAAESYIERVVEGRKKLLIDSDFVSIPERNLAMQERGERVSPAIVIVDDMAHTRSAQEVDRWILPGRNIGVYYLGAGSTRGDYERESVLVQHTYDTEFARWHCLGDAIDEYVVDPTPGDTEVAAQAVHSAFAQWMREREGAAANTTPEDTQEAAKEATQEAAREPQPETAQEAMPEVTQEATQEAAQDPQPEKSAAPAETAPAAAAPVAAGDSGDVSGTAGADKDSVPPEEAAGAGED